MVVYMDDFSQANLSQGARVMSVSGSMRTDTMIGQDECALCTRGAGEGRANYVPHHQHRPRPEHLVLMPVSTGTRRAEVHVPKFTASMLEKPDWHTSRNQHSKGDHRHFKHRPCHGHSRDWQHHHSVVAYTVPFFLPEKGTGPSPHQANHTQQISNIGGSRRRDGTTARRHGH